MKTEYCLVKGQYIAAFENAMRLKVEDGWIPVGNILTVRDSDGTTYIVQSAIRYTKEVITE